jgi:hypothetical protein
MSTPPVTPTNVAAIGVVLELCDRLRGREGLADATISEVPIGDPKGITAAIQCVGVESGTEEWTDLGAFRTDSEFTVVLEVFRQTEVGWDKDTGRAAYLGVDALVAEIRAELKRDPAFIASPVTVVSGWDFTLEAGPTSAGYAVAATLRIEFTASNTG